MAIKIIGKRWFQKTYGNTYHSVRVIVDGEQVAYVPFQYGYGEQYLQTAFGELVKLGLIPADSDRQWGTRYLREVLKGEYSVEDVQRKKDL